MTDAEGAGRKTRRTPAAARDAAILHLVRSAYESPHVVSRYASVGLWPAEEALVLDFFPDDGRVLDLGCGAGRTSIALAEIGLPVLGIDISELMIDVARAQAEHLGLQDRAEFAVMDSRHLDVPDGAFAAALYSYNGLELVPGLEGKRRVLAEVHRALVPGGRFVFCVHSLYACNRHVPMRLGAFARFLLGQLGLPMRERELGERFIDDEFEEARYLQVLPPSRYRRLLRQAGFDVLHVNTRRRIERGRRPRPWAFWEDTERLFVAEKRQPGGRTGPRGRRSGEKSGEPPHPADR